MNFTHMMNVETFEKLYVSVTSQRRKNTVL